VWSGGSLISMVARIWRNAVSPIMSRPYIISIMAS
jgi:hypothetical protein